AAAQGSRPADSGPDLDEALFASIADAVADAARTAASGPAAGPAALGSGTVDALRRAVAQCWNIGPLSTEAQAVTVTVGFRLARDATPEGDVRMIDYTGGSEAAARQAFEAARRAILRCGATGFPLPADSYDAWREVEMTFNPESMRIR
ncbi:energy transducer TonB, partial [Rhodobaculum claviforme]|nr:energy transducer TonB [Rhodobaculum claviforme]